jgi:HEAT repeat protein
LEEGNSSKANYHFDKVQEIINFLKAQDAITELFKFLKYPHPYVRLDAAFHLKDYDEKVCLEVVESIEKNEKGAVSSTAYFYIKAIWGKSISCKETSSSHSKAERFEEKSNSFSLSY